MGKSKGSKDISPGKKPGPLTKKERKERKKKEKRKKYLEVNYNVDTAIEWFGDMLFRRWE